MNRNITYLTSLLSFNEFEKHVIALAKNNMLVALLARFFTQIPFSISISFFTAKFSLLILFAILFYPPSRCLNCLGG